MRFHNIKQNEYLSSMNRPYSRRTLLQQMCLGFGGVALQGLMPNSAHATRTGTASNSPLAPKQPHIRARAKRVIFLFMHGGPSQTETFDPKMDQPTGVRSATGEVATSIPGVSYGATFSKLAKLAHKTSIVRSCSGGE